MRGLAIGCLVLTAGLAAQADGVSAVSRQSDRAIERLAAETGGTARIHTHPATGVARFVRVDPGTLALAGTTPVERASEFLGRYGAALGIEDAASELSEPDVRVDALGSARVTYTQRYRGLPVFAGVVRAHFDDRGRIKAVNGTFVPDISVDIRPSLTAAEAVAIAFEDVRSRLTRPPAATLEPTSVRLLVFRSGLVRRVLGRDHLAWEVEVGNGLDVRETLFVDARTGKIVDRIQGIHEALDRQIHEGQFEAVILWSEGETLPYDTGDAVNDEQVNGLIDFAAETHGLFSDLSGGNYLSFDGSDATMHAVWKSTSLDCPNASWNGTSTNYCDGVASDDIVGHEWTHGYTQATHGLIYQWQPGALNESYSDIFGDVLDLLNGSGTDAPNLGRTVGDCSTVGGTPHPELQVFLPAPIAGPYFAAGAAFNPAPPLSTSASVELADDGDASQGGSLHDACQDLVGFTAGSIAFVDRGNCSFVDKAARAQNAGAAGMIVANYNDEAFHMTGSDPAITIPSVMVSSSNGLTIRDQLASGVSASIEIDESSSDSVRWLVGEDSFGFGGAIRDMWNPTCFGDPGKVSDGQYQCSPGDAGGVHTNSGVPNHAFALLVDGGTFNGQSISAIGMLKAAHIYWRAMSVYQVPDSDFADHALALAQSCGDLIGVDLPGFGGGAASGEMLSGSDCEQLDRATLAIEAADDPPCVFGPLLEPGAPAMSCGAVAFFDDFEGDPTSRWSLANSGVFGEYLPRDWVLTTELPEGGDGAAFFGIDSISIGNCIQGDDDQSGVMYLESPSITLGGEARVAFDHWVATEPLYDGANVKVSVNGGPAQLVGGGSFLFNPYNDVLTEDGNPNPLAGEEAWTGADGGVVTGSWGQSQIDLSSFADAGDAIRLRFDLGVDGCNGLTGWYVDNVRVCTAEYGSGHVSELRVDRSGTNIILSWEPSCLTGDNDHGIYEGDLGDYASHVSRFCTTLGSSFRTFAPAAGSSYYLVVPLNGDREGSYGTDSSGDERQQGGGACAPQALAPSCD